MVLSKSSNYDKKNRLYAPWIDKFRLWILLLTWTNEDAIRESYPHITSQTSCQVIFHADSLSRSWYAAPWSFKAYGYSRKYTRLLLRFVLPTAIVQTPPVYPPEPQPWPAGLAFIQNCWSWRNGRRYAFRRILIVPLQIVSDGKSVIVLRSADLKRLPSVPCWKTVQHSFMRALMKCIIQGRAGIWIGRSITPAALNWISKKCSWR